MKLIDLLENITHKKILKHGDEVHVLSIDGGYLEYGEEDNVFILTMVEVKQSHRNHGIATLLIKEFLKIVDDKKGSLTITEFLDDGEKFLSKVIERLKPSYPNITWF